MQGLIEDAIRFVGYLALRIVTVGRYRGGKEDDRLAEGALGLATVTVGIYMAAKFR
jgi:hypothetical protein